MIRQLIKSVSLSEILEIAYITEYLLRSLNPAVSEQWANGEIELNSIRA